MPSSVAFAPPNQPPAVVAPEGRGRVDPEAGEFKPFGADGLTFGDLLDIVNPLQHLPLIGSIYRAITGDTISPASRVTGGALFGGLIGFAASVADMVLKEASGKDVAGHVLALMENAQGTPEEKPSRPEGTREARWSETASLRHDAYDDDDGWWEDPDPVAKPGNVAAAQPSAAAAPAASPPAARTVSLRHDAYDDDDGWWEDPDTAAKPENVAAVNRPVTTGADRDSGPRALGTALPRPRALAANPAMVTAFRKGQSRNFRPGGMINSDTWLQLMNNVSANRGPNAAPTGAGGLASATLAKGLATYGAAEAAALKAGNPPIRP